MTKKVIEKWLQEHYGKLGTKVSESIESLNEQQRTFAEVYVRTGSAPQAAREAGIRTKEPQLLLHVPKISAYINLVAAKLEHDLGRASTKELLSRVQSTPNLTKHEGVLPPELLKEVQDQLADDGSELSAADEDVLLGNVEAAAKSDMGIAQVPPVKMLINETFGPEWIMEQLVRVAERCLQIEPVYDKQGRPVGQFNFNAGGALKALELLGKTMAMFKERVDVGDLSKAEPTEVDQRIAALVSAHPELGKLVGDGNAKITDQTH